MAERSFAREVESLRLAAGQTFEGEAILAVTKALPQAGVGYVGGYQGAPVSHLMDVLSDAHAILSELGVRFEASASEATAAAMLAASVNYPIRGAVTWKSTVGTNVASDALSNLASAGVTGGALIVLGFLTRLAVLPTLAIMLVAIVSTKVPILLESGFWKMAHEARTDWSMLLGSLFLLLVGAGPWSVDAVWSRERSTK